MSESSCAAHAEEGSKERQHAQKSNDQSRTGASDIFWTKANQTGRAVLKKSALCASKILGQNLSNADI
jgi:hypothetical protein